MVSLSLLVTCSFVSLAAALKFTLVLPVSHILPGAGGIIPCIPPDIPVFGPNRIYIRLRSRKVCHILVCHLQMGLHHHSPTCLCCCSCCCSSCSLSVSNTTGSTRIIKEVVPTQSAVREKLKQVHIVIKLCCLCHFCFHLISAALYKCTHKAS